MWMDLQLWWLDEDAGVSPPVTPLVPVSSVRPYTGTRDVLTSNERDRPNPCQLGRYDSIEGYALLGAA